MESRSLALLAAALLASPAALADEQRTSFMLWGSALDGEMQLGPASGELSMSLEDVLNVLDGSITLRHDALGESFGWYAEYVFNDLKQEADTLGGVAQANLEQEILEVGFSKPLNGSWDGYAGLRSESIDMSLDFPLLPTAAGDASWVDVLVGVRWHHESSGSRWWARGDIAGGGSDGAWLLEAGGAWRFGESWEFSLAYRALDTEYGEGAFAIDLLQHGAVLGVSKAW